MVEIVISVAAKISEYLVAPMILPFTYATTKATLRISRMKLVSWGFPERVCCIGWMMLKEMGKILNRKLRSG